MTPSGELEALRTQVRRLDERLAAARDASASGTFWCDLRSSAIDCDASFSALYGCAPGTTISSMHDLIVRIHPDDYPEVLRQWQGSVDAGADVDLEHRVIWPGGEVRWLAVHGRRSRDASGDAHVVGATRDITERKRVDAEREADRSYQLLTDTMPQLVWTATGAGRLDYTNQRWFEYTGRCSEATSREGMLAVLHPDDRARVHEHWECAVDRGAPMQIQARLRRGDGAHRWFLIRALPMRGLGGDVLRWFGTCTDIDEQKRAEAQIEEANRAKDDFLAMLGHELRNPLAPIVAALELMRDKSAGLLERERKVIERQVDHLVRLVDDLLDVARINRGKIELRRAPLDVADVIAGAVETVTPAIQERHHLLDVTAPHGQMLVDGDRARLAQVVGNLLGNAAKYTPPGGHIRLVARRDRHEVVIEVSDDGVGIAAELRPRIFDLFVQGERTSDRTDAGLGIGLTVVRDLVALHGGHVEVASGGAGTGSTFTVRLPALLSTRTVAPEAPPPPAREVPAQRVLVVDDNLDVAELFAELLRAHGHTVAIVHDGAAALQLAEAFHPDTAMIDIGLPVMDGYQLAAQLRARLGDDCPRLVAVTGYGQARDQARSRVAGFDVHLVKPVDSRRLLAGLAAASRPRPR